MVIYPHKMCTYLLLDVYVYYITKYIHNNVHVFLQASLTAGLLSNTGQTERQTKTTATVSAGLAKSRAFTGLNLSNVRHMVSRARRESQATGRPAARVNGSGRSLYSTRLHLVFTEVNLHQREKSEE